MPTATYAAFFFTCKGRDRGRGGVVFRVARREAVLVSCRRLRKTFARWVRIVSLVVAAVAVAAEIVIAVVKGNVSDTADVAKVITKDTTGIVVSLGGKTKDVGATMLTDGTTNVINAMKAAGIDKDGECFFSLFWLFWLFWLSSYGQLV